MAPTLSSMFLEYNLSPFLDEINHEILNDKKFKYPDNEHAISINKVDYYIRNILELKKARG